MERINIMAYTIDTKAYMDRAINACKRKGLNINLTNPKTIQDKLTWLNIYDTDPMKSFCADKIKVHEYCKDKLGKDICIPIIKVYDKPQDINFDELPDKFVAKCNHGSGMNIIVKDKKTANKKEIIDKLNTWLGRDFTFQNGFEAHYHDIERKAFIEQYMNDGHEDLCDYKFLCFNGEPKYLQVISDRHNAKKRLNYYDMNLKKCTISRTDFRANYSMEDSLPTKFGEMVEYAKKLSEPFKFVRVDFYEINGVVYLGELTFTPGVNYFRYTNREDEIKVGNMLKL